MVSKTFLFTALATAVLAQQPSATQSGAPPAQQSGPADSHQPGDKIFGKAIHELGNGVYSGNDDGSFTFLFGNNSAPAPSKRDTVKSRLFARGAFPGTVTCESKEGAVDQYDLQNAINNFASYCGTQHAVDANSYAFTKYDQAVVYMCEQGSHTGYCKSPEVTDAMSAIQTACPNGESGYSSNSDWYKTYGYKVASDAKICGKTP